MVHAGDRRPHEAPQHVPEVHAMRYRGARREGGIVSEPTLRPIAELPPTPDELPAVRPDELHALGKMGNQSWHAGPHMAVAGPAPAGSKSPEIAGQDFGGWLTKHSWFVAEPVGWWSDGSDEIVKFSPPWKSGQFHRNFLNGRYFRVAVRLGAVSWKCRHDRTVVVARNADDEPVALIACMQLLDGDFPQ